MKIAITGGTGFVGSHLARSLNEHGHETVLISRRMVGIDNAEKLAAAFEGCDAVAHCAGINREVEPGDYQRVHVDGTRHVVNAAQVAGVKKIVLVSFYRARPNCGSPYHESKYAAEEIVRNSGLNYAVLKPGMIYGKGDHMLDHLSHVFHTLPIFAMVGFKKQQAAPLAIEDMVKIMEASLIQDRLSNQTIPILGPERMTLEQAVRHVAKVVGRTPIIFPMPIAFHHAFAKVLEATMVIPLVSSAQVRILTEGFDEPYGCTATLPDDLQPTIRFTDDQIRKGLPQPGPFTMNDLRCCHSS